MDLDKLAQALNQVSQYKIKDPVLGKILFIIILLAVVIGLLFVGWYAYGKFFKAKNKDTVVTGQSSSTTYTVPSPIQTFVSSTDTVVTTTASSSDAINGQTTDKILLFPKV